MPIHSILLESTPMYHVSVWGHTEHPRCDHARPAIIYPVLAGMVWKLKPWFEASTQYKELLTIALLYSLIENKSRYKEIYKIQWLKSAGLIILNARFSGPSPKLYALYQWYFCYMLMAIPQASNTTNFSNPINPS